MNDRRTNLIAAVAALLVMTVAVFAFSRGDSATVSTPFGDSPVPETTIAPVTETTMVDAPDSGAAVTSPTTAETTVAFDDAAVSDLPTITPDELPIEAIETLALITAGGPFPYRQDDGIFQNREGILPSRPDGHYREYTVDTPGSPDRGARRIVTGSDGERYWTDDHYDSFREIVG